MFTIFCFLVRCLVWKKYVHVHVCGLFTYGGKMSRAGIKYRVPDRRGLFIEIRSLFSENMHMPFLENVKRVILAIQATLDNKSRPIMICINHGGRW